MSKKGKINLPSIGGGLFRPTGEGRSEGPQIKPEFVIGAAALIIVFELILHFYGAALF